LAASQKNTTGFHAAVNSTLVAVDELDIKRQWRAMSPRRGCEADISQRPAGHLDAGRRGGGDRFAEALPRGVGAQARV
jgi:hypothetical protein